MKNTLLLSIIVLLIASCSKDQSLVKSDQAIPQSISKERRDQLKTSFGKAIAVALAESPELRKLLKDEALEMFDNDYDVLYHLIKKKELTNGKTVREFLLPYFESENQLIEIENGVPLLTIFVPTLPENTFSAQAWDTKSQIPSVGVTSYQTNDVKIFDHKGSELIIPADQIPGFPVVVIKENERVVLKNSNTRTLANGRAFRSTGEMDFVFLANCFDHSSTRKNSAARFVQKVDYKIDEAYEIYNGKDGWQRDYIYYNITPNQTRGQFSYDFSEHITMFSMLGDPTSAYSKIADQTGDPKLGPYVQGNVPNSGWTGGFYEFKVKVLFNAKNGLNQEYITYFSALPQDLFQITYTKYFSFNNIYKTSITGLKAIALNLPLFSWDLNSYASTISIDIEEVDLTETIVTTETRISKFATNFGIDPTDGLLKKIGLKFGASLEQTLQQSIQKTYTQGNDPLGSVIVNFADNVIVQKSTYYYFPYRTYNTREYPASWFTLCVEPKRVQN